ncbi:PQQ-binding-like beta-propeller repeat protein [Streptomyces sp. NPDC001922]|uniref:outer membrane protein assembly factor BamB family protein n=1 Tax=Streptomyces sp. NPDC001922 TaxID=3364624 RepID=UPI0036D170B6
MSQQPSYGPSPDQRPPQIWDTGLRPPRPPSEAPGFGPPPPAFGPPADGPGLPGDGGGPPRGGGAGTRRTALIITLALVLVAGLGTAGWLLMAGGEDRPEGAPLPKHRTASRIAWEEPVPTLEDSVQPTSGTWFTDRYVAKALPNKVVAYDLASGDRAWTVPLDGVVCATSTEAVAGRAAVQHGEGCRKLTVIDLEKKRELWTDELHDPTDPENFMEGELALSEKLVVLTSGSGSAAYRIDNKKKVYRDNGYVEDCSLSAAAGEESGKSLLVVASCGEAGGRQVWALDPETARRKNVWDVPDNLDVTNILSTSPPVIALQSQQAESVEYILRLRPGNRKPTKISVGEKGQYLCANDSPRCSDIVVTDDTVYLSGPTHESYGDGATLMNEVVAYDLGTGKSKRLLEPDNKRELEPFAVLDGDLIAYEPPTEEKGGVLLRYDAETGKRTVYERHPDWSSERESAIEQDAVPLLHRGMFFLAAEEIYSREEGESPKPLIAAFR